MNQQMDHESAAVTPDTDFAKARGRWRISLRVFLLAIPVLGGGVGVLGILVRWNVEQVRLNRTIHPILTQHEAIVAVKQDEIVWLSLSRIDPSATGIQDLHEFGITHFHSSVGLQGTRPASDADLERLLYGMPNLRALDLRKTNTTAAVLAHVSVLKNLEWLWLDAAHCTDASLDHLHGIRSLRRLSPDRTKLSDASLARLREALPDCHIYTDP